MTGNLGLVIVAGAGPGLGHALLQRFGDGGYKAVGFTRSPADNTQALDVWQIDLTDRKKVNDALKALTAEYGIPKVVIHNSAQLVIHPLMETTLEEFEGAWRSIVMSAFVLAQAVMPEMASRGEGVFIASGATASVRGGNKFTAFASAKFALRGLIQSLAREYQPQGIHVAHVLLDGIIDSAHSRDLHTLDPSRMMKPTNIAETYWHIAHQPQSTWSHEVDLRPFNEKF
jgi:NAD(P)-dependent dehydrogenase (short-subunit alcohol dehydrogenase family)